MHVNVHVPSTYMHVNVHVPSTYMYMNVHVYVCAYASKNTIIHARNWILHMLTVDQYFFKAKFYIILLYIIVVMRACQELCCVHGCQSIVKSCLCAWLLAVSLLLEDCFYALLLLRTYFPLVK